MMDYHQSCQRIPFEGGSELVLLPSSFLSQQEDNSNKNDINRQTYENVTAGALVSLDLQNFTGRIVIRGQSTSASLSSSTIEKSNPASLPVEKDLENNNIKSTESDDAAASVEASLSSESLIEDPPTPRRKNPIDEEFADSDFPTTDTISNNNYNNIYDVAAALMKQRKPAEMSEDFNATNTETAGGRGIQEERSDFVDGVAFSNVALPSIAEMASCDETMEDENDNMDDSISDQVHNFVSQVGDPSRDDDTVNFEESENAESDSVASSDQVLLRGRFRTRDEQESYSIDEPSENNGDPSDRMNERTSFEEVSDTSNHSASGRFESGTESGASSNLPGSSRNEKMKAGKQRSSSLGRGPKKGKSKSAPVSPAGPTNEFFNRAVNMFSRATVAKQSVSAQDVSTPTSDSGRNSWDRKSSSSRGSAGELIEKPSILSRHSRGSSWDKVLQVYAVKKHVPALIRQKRIEERRASMSQNLTNQPSVSLFPSRLHELCAEPDATLAELVESLDANKEAVFKKDHQGKLPLHILGDNEGLISSPQGKQAATAFAWKLMEANPDAITVRDAHGHMPFVTLITDWVSWVYESHKKLRKAKQAASPGIFPLRIQGANAGSGEVQSAPRDISNAFFARKTEDFASTSRMFPKPEVWDEVEWCFGMLSLACDELAGKSGVLFKTTRRDVFANNHASSRPKPKKPDAMRREMVCHLLETMPDLLKTVLLIESEGGEMRNRILKMSIFRRMFLCHECVGEWLTQMLRKTGSASRRAVDFLQLISDTKVADYTGGFRATAVEDVEHFHREQREVFNAVSGLEGTIGSLVTMENRQTEKAAATGVIWHIMGERLARPFVLGLVLVDLVLHISLMIAFRNNVQINESRIGEISTQSVLFICSHYLIRKGCEGLALLTISPQIFRGYFTNVWTLFDLMAIALTMTAFVWNDKNPGEYRNGFNAFVVGLLWMKVVGFLKVVNKDMSTFILALLEILGDIKYFLIVLVVVIFMFGDMAHLAVSTKDNGAFCKRDDLEGPTVDFCNTELTSSYLRVYSILLGDFELNDLQDSTGITTIYVIFTSLGVVILLNVLIAVISDSYEKATVSSAMLFGRARVTFVAQNEALEAFLRPGANPMQIFKKILAPRTALSRLFTVFRWCVLLAIIATACDTALFLVLLSISSLQTKENFVTAFLLCLLSLVLVSALGVLVGFAFRGMVHRVFPGYVSRGFDLANNCCVSLVRWLAFRLFGLHTRKQMDPSRASADDWSGRLNYMESIFEKVVENAKKELVSELSALETRLYEHDLAQRDHTSGGEPNSNSLPTSPPLTFPMRRSK